MSQVITVHKVTLSTGKSVLLREFKMKQQELAIKATGNRAGSNEMLQKYYMQLELIKQLIVQVNDKDVDKNALEDLDNLFSPVEYNQIQQAVQQISGMGEENLTPKLEIITDYSGSKSLG